MSGYNDDWYNTVTLRQWFDREKIWDKNPIIKFYRSDEKWYDVTVPLQPTKISGDEPWLDQKFYKGFGGADVSYFVIWTDDKVYYRHEYDGATELWMVLRNPPEVK